MTDFPIPLLPVLAGVFLVAVVVSRSAWAREPLAIRRGHALAAALFVGLLGGAGILLGNAALTGLDTEREQRLDEAEAGIRRDQLSAAEVRRIAIRQARSERPTDRELARRILRALELIRRSPSLQRSAGTVGPAAAGLAAGPLPQRERERAGRDSRPRTRRPSRRTRRPDRSRPQIPTNPGGPPPDAPPPPPRPPKPRPPVDVETPPGLPLPQPSVCTDVLGINC